MGFADAEAQLLVAPPNLYAFFPAVLSAKTSDRYKLPDWEQAKTIIMASDEKEIITRRIYQFHPDLKWDTDHTGVTTLGKP